MSTMTPAKPTRLAERGLRPIQELARERDHGDRLRYMSGCRCDACRGANARYEQERAAARRRGEWNGIVSAERSRLHLAELSRLGVGRRSVQDVCGIADTVLCDIIAGRKRQVRAATERAILGVTRAAAADRAVVDASPTWRLLDALVKDGYTKAELAQALGYKRPALQFRRTRVTVRTAHEVHLLYERLKCCDARRALALLADLREEGFRQDRIEAGLASLAAARGWPPPDLRIRRGKIREDAAQLVVELHHQLTS